MLLFPNIFSMSCDYENTGHIVHVDRYLHSEKAVASVKYERSSTDLNLKFDNSIQT